MSFKKPKAPAPTPEQLALEADQRVQSAELDSMENQRRKRLLSAMQGVRAFRGSALFRSKPADRAGGATSSSAAPASGIVDAPVDVFSSGRVGKFY